MFLTQISLFEKQGLTNSWEKLFVIFMFFFSNFIDSGEDGTLMSVKVILKHSPQSYKYARLTKDIDRNTIAFEKQYGSKQTHESRKWRLRARTCSKFNSRARNRRSG